MNVELLQRVKAAILAEPNKYNQDKICGSKCCIAGHAVAIADPEAWEEVLELDPDESGPHIAVRAKELLGLSEAKYDRLCGYAYQWPKKFYLKYEYAHSDVERARIGAARIDHFIGNGGRR